MLQQLVELLFFNPDLDNGYLPKYEFGHFFYAHRFASEIYVASKFIYEQKTLCRSSTHPVKPKVNRPIRRIKKELHFTVTP